jgi:hypothetical protein
MDFSSNCEGSIARPNTVFGKKNFADPFVGLTAAPCRKTVRQTC